MVSSPDIKQDIQVSYKKWLQSKTFSADFETCVRNKRLHILNSWVDTLTNRPQRHILNSLGNFHPEINYPRPCYPTEVGDPSDPKCIGIFGIEGL